MQLCFVSLSVLPMKLGDIPVWRNPAEPIRGDIKIDQYFVRGFYIFGITHAMERHTKEARLECGEFCGQRKDPCNSIYRKICKLRYLKFVSLFYLVSILCSNVSKKKPKDTFSKQPSQMRIIKLILVCLNNSLTIITKRDFARSEHILFFPFSVL